MDRYEVSGDPLFLTRAVLGDLEKEATFKMSRDVEKWEEDIMGLLHEQYPFLQEYQTRIHMNKTDPDTGMGVGQIVLDEKIGIPVIIDSFKMHPLDLFYHGGKLRPMTKPTLLGALQETGIGTPVAPGMGEAMDMSLYTDTRPPSSGRYSMASSLMFTQGQLESVLNEMGEQSLAYALGMNPAFKKTAAVFATNAKKEIEKTAEAKPTYSIREVHLTPFEPIVEPGAYVVIVGGMKKTAGFVFDNVIDLNDRVLPNMMLFCGFDGTVAMAENPGGIKIDGDFSMDGDSKDLDKVAMYSDDISSPGYGFFWMSKKGHTVATLPVKLLYRGTNPEGLPFVKVADASVEGQTRTVFASNDYRGLHVDADTIFMGPEWKWKRCGESVKVADVRTANALEWPQDVVTLRHKSGLYHLSGWDDVRSLSKEGSVSSQVYPVLVDVLGEAKAFYLMKKAEDEGSVFFHVDKKGGGTNGSYRCILPESLGPVNLSKEAAFVRPVERFEFFKFAAEVPEDDAEETVDALLGLNFINDENIHRFLEKTDDLDEAVSVLSSLLLASRLGLQIEEAPIRTSLFAADEVVRQLKQLRNVTYASEE
jgi:hypothetical protein